MPRQHKDLAEPAAAKHRLKLISYCGYRLEVHTESLRVQNKKSKDARPWTFMKLDKALVLSDEDRPREYVVCCTALFVEEDRQKTEPRQRE